MQNRVQILDCTLRDGGLGLEDAYKNNIADIGFTVEHMDEIIHHLSQSCIDIIELGSIEISNEDKHRFAIYQDVESISKKIPSNRSKQQMYVGLFRGPDTPIEDIPDWNPSLVDGVRVIIRYSELQKSLDFCAALSQKGYKVFVQPMLTMRYIEEELDLIIREANKMNAFALYFVDSYGYMQQEDILRFLNRFDQGLNESISIGFHAHNNMNMAYANATAFIGQNKKRNLIVDACAIGMGQGAGNLQTELIVPHLNKVNNGKYKYKSILAVCEIVEKYLEPSVWGYSVTRLLPALHQTAYKYAISLRNQYNLTFLQIDEVLSQMPEDLRHRYTPQNTEMLLRSAGYIE